MVSKVVRDVKGRAADMWIGSGTVNAEDLSALNLNNRVRVRVSHVSQLSLS